MRPDIYLLYIPPGDCVCACLCLDLCAGWMGFFGNREEGMRTSGMQKRKEWLFIQGTVVTPWSLLICSPGRICGCET